MPQLVVNNPTTTVMIIIAQICVLVATLINIISTQSTTLSRSLLIGLALTLALLAFGTSILCALFIFPKYWGSKALSASDHIERGGIILVLGCRVGATTISFAEQVVRQGKTPNIKFVFVDDFSKWGHPYKPKALVQILTGIGIPQQHIVAHAINTKDNGNPIVSYGMLPFANGSISLIISGHMLEHSTQWEDMCIKEMIRVLQPGGRMIVAGSRFSWGSLKATVLKKCWKYVRLEKAGSMHWIDATKLDNLLELNQPNESEQV